MMNGNVFFVVLNEDGSIARSGSTQPQLVELQARDGEISIKADKPYSGADYYYDGNGIAERPANPAQLVGMSITNVPEGSLIEIEGITYPVDDGVAELAFNFAGTYQVELRSFPYCNETFEVTV